MKTSLLIAAATAAVAFGGALAQAATVTANDGADLAAKIVLANSDSDINVIRCVSFRACDVTGTLPTFTGSQRLVINGRGSTIDASGIDDEDVISRHGRRDPEARRLDNFGRHVRCLCGGARHKDQHPSG